MGVRGDLLRVMQRVGQRRDKIPSFVGPGSWGPSGFLWQGHGSTGKEMERPSGENFGLLSVWRWGGVAHGWRTCPPRVRVTVTSNTSCPLMAVTFTPPSDFNQLPPGSTSTCRLNATWHFTSLLPMTHTSSSPPSPGLTSLFNFLLFAALEIEPRGLPLSYLPGPFYF